MIMIWVIQVKLSVYLVSKFDIFFIFFKNIKAQS